MSYDEWDAARDEFYEKVRDELTPEIINEFKSDRLTAYFESCRDIAEKPLAALNEARKLQNAGFYTASFIHATIASEVTIKSVFIHPLIQGVVHNDIIAPLVTEMVLDKMRSQFDNKKVKELFSTILSEVANIDLETYSRKQSKTTLLAEVFEIQRKRNGILHRAETATMQECDFALSIATEVLEQVFPRLAKGLGYHIHDGFRLCRNFSCSMPPHVRKLIDERIGNKGK